MKCYVRILLNSLAGWLFYLSYNILKKLTLFFEILKYCWRTEFLLLDYAPNFMRNGVRDHENHVMIRAIKGWLSINLIDSVHFIVIHIGP